MSNDTSTVPREQPAILAACQQALAATQQDVATGYEVYS